MEVTRKGWEPEYVNKLIELYPKASWEQIEAALPDFTRAAIVHKANRLHLYRQTVEWLTDKYLELDGYNLGWLCAFTEGEGHFGVYKPKRGSYHPHIFWANTEMPLIERIKQLLNIELDLRPIQPSQPNRKPVYRLGVRGLDDARQVLELLQPNLIGKKKRQAELILELIQIKAQTPQSRWMGRDSRQEEIYQEVRALNKRGPG